MPRIRYTFQKTPTRFAATNLVVTDSGSHEPAEQVQQAVAQTVYEDGVGSPIPSDVEAKIMAMSLDIDDEPLKIQSCYSLSEQRARRYAAMTDCDGNVLFPDLAKGGYVATCT